MSLNPAKIFDLRNFKHFKSFYWKRAQTLIDRCFEIFVLIFDFWTLNFRNKYQFDFTSLKLLVYG